jgi:HlyD family secretion protein
MKQTWMLVAVIATLAPGCNRNATPENALFVSGRIDGDMVDISSKIQGRVVNLTVREGDSVEAGQVIAWLESAQQQAIRDAQKARIVSGQRTVDELERDLGTYDEKVRQAELYTDQARADAPGQVQQAEANLAAAKADLARWEAEHQQVQLDAKRYPPLAKSGAVPVQVAQQYQTKEEVAEESVNASRKQVAAAEAALVRARAQLDNIAIQDANRRTLLQQAEAHKAKIAAAKADVEADRAALRKIEADIADLQIRAPIAGTILTRSAEPGRVIQPGQTILTMVDLAKLYLRGFVPQGNIGKVKVGQKAEVYLDSNPKQPIPAEVIRIDPEVMFTPENTYFKEDRVKQVMGLKLGLRGAYGYAKPGMPADGHIQLQSAPEQARAGRS